MPFSDREEKILDILRRQGSAGAEEMARELYISRPTLRRDLMNARAKGRRQPHARRREAHDKTRGRHDTRVTQDGRGQRSEEHDSG